MNTHNTTNALLAGALAYVLVVCAAGGQGGTGRAAPAPNAVQPLPVSRVPAVPDWLVGKWAFDEQQTAKKHAAAKAPEGLDAIRENLVVPQLTEKLKGARLTITDKEVILTTKDGNGKANAFEVLEVEEGKSATLKQTDGEVTTYHRDGEHVWIASTGNVNVPFFFKRAQ